MLNRNGKNGPLCLVSDLGGKAFNRSPLNMLLTMDFFILDIHYQLFYPNLLSVLS